MKTAFPSRTYWLGCGWLIAVAAGCAGGTPTGVQAFPDAQYDTGVGFGSGNRTTSVGAPEVNTTAADSGSTAGRTGVGFGSGN